jgi:hypothetical protein
MAYWRRLPDCAVVVIGIQNKDCAKFADYGSDLESLCNQANPESAARKSQQAISNINCRMA